MKTIATFGSSEEAHLLRARLEAAGFEVFVINEHGTQTISIFSGALGEVRVQAADEDVEEIQRYLAEEAAASPEPEPEPL